MATYEVTLPDGRVATIETAEGPQESALLPAASAGLSRGVLETLDIVPRGLAGLGNVLLGAAGQEPMAWRGTPFSTLAELGGVGTYQPQTPAEENIALAGEVIGSSLIPGAGVASRAASPIRTGLTEATAAMGAAGGAVAGGGIGEEIGRQYGQRELGGQIGQTAGTIAGGFTPSGAQALARRFVSPYGAAEMGPMLAASRRQQIPVTAGEAMGGSLTEAASSSLPGGARRAETFREMREPRFRERIEEIGAELTPREGSPEVAGRAITEGLENWTAGFRNRGRELYGQLDELVPPDTPTRLENTRQLLDETVVQDAFSSVIDAPLMRQLGAAMEETGLLDYQTARRIRTRIGESLTDPSLIPDAPRGQLKRLYAALSSDLEEIAAQAGPEAERAFSRSNAYWRAGIQRVDDFLDPIQKRVAPEEVYAASQRGAKDGASRLRALKRSLEPEQWNVVVKTVLRRMGRTRPSERTGGELTEEAADFSPETFLTNLENLDPKARSVLFTGTGYERLEADMRDLMQLSQGIRAQRQQAFNPSGTAGALANMAGVAAPVVTALYNPMQAARLVGGIGGNVALRSALESPEFINYLANPQAFSPSPLGQISRAFGTQPFMPGPYEQSPLSGP